MEGAKPPINEEDRMTMKKIQKDRSDLDKAVETGNPFYGMEGNEGYVKEEPQQKDEIIEMDSVGGSEITDISKKKNTAPPPVPLQAPKSIDWNKPEDRMAA
jgi:hypothetical protein